MPPFRGVNSKTIRTILALFPDVRSDTTHHSTHPLRFHDVKTETMPHCASYIFVVCWRQEWYYAPSHFFSCVFMTSRLKNTPHLLISLLFPDVRSDTIHHFTFFLRFRDVKIKTPPLCTLYISVVSRRQEWYCAPFHLLFVLFPGCGWLGSKHRPTN